MIRIENTIVTGFESAIRGMRNPMNSWEKSDTDVTRTTYFFGDLTCCGNIDAVVGNNDLKLMQSLVKAGTDHSKFMRMINVSCDITAPRYWWTEYDTYKVGTVRNSCSTMHKIADKEFEPSDFSREHLTTLDFQHYDILDTEEVERIEFQTASTEILRLIIQCLNNYRKLYLATKNKKYWWQMIQILPQSYNQRATVQLNYAVLRKMYHARKNHKLDEWVEFCKWIETLPYSELITM